jgi:hypothetical protein
VIPFVHWRVDPATKIYTIPRMAKGPRELKILRCPKRYVGREILKLLQPLAP